MEEKLEPNIDGSALKTMSRKVKELNQREEHACL